MLLTVFTQAYTRLHEPPGLWISVNYAITYSFFQIMQNCYPLKPLINAYRRWEVFSHHELTVVSPNEVVSSVSYEVNS